MKNFIVNLLIFLLLFIMTPFAVANEMIIKNLRCEYLENPLGIDVLQPRLSWILESNQRGQKQSAFQILIATGLEKLDKNIGDAWDSGKVESTQSVHNYYAGVPLQSDGTYFWKVRVWDKDGNPSSWSESAFWSMGLLNDTDWKAKWIGLDKAVGDDDPDAEHRRLSARILRYEFLIKKKIKRATAFICGLGLFELYVNGEKIGDQVLSPGLTEYNKRSFYMTFDVKDFLQQKNNAVGVVLGNGRYFAPRGEKPTKTLTYGFPKLLLQINTLFEDGTSISVVSDEKWKLTTDGPIQANCEYDGEIYDARTEANGWSKIGFNDSQWRNVELVEKPGEKLVAQMNEPIKVMETIQPVAVTEPQPGIFIFDMGQNMVGWVQLKVKGERGTKISLKFAEVLHDDGMLFMDNIRGAKVTDVYILKGGATETWEPKFTYHGFRYVEVKGFPGKPDLSAIEGKVVYDAVETSGTFSCSNPLINNIYKNAYWGIRGNYRSIPTDCPQRDERQGWLGDRSAESRGESYIFDIVKLYNKWLVDIQDAQLENGSVPNVAPSYWPMYSDNTTWPGSFIIIPAMLYDQYGDLETLRRHYPSMKKWIDHMSQYLQDGIMPRDTYGDWCVPPEDARLIHSNDPKRTTSGEFIGTAYFYHELKLMGRFAILLNKPADASNFQNLAKKMKTAFNEKFLNENPLKYSNNTQTVNVLALTFGLVPEKYQTKIFENLVEKIMGENEGHIGTGLIGCQWLMRVLTENGRSDIAYTLASQHTYPSWGYMVEHGATTIWELWNGDTGDPGMNSHNHVMLLGDLIIWFYENLAGIKADPEQPAFKHIIMRPEIVGDLDFVKASYASMHGPIKSEWKINNNKFYWDISIPPNTTATIYVPASNENVVRESGLVISESNGIEFIRWENNRTTYQIESGKYSFTSEGFIIKTPEPYVSTPVFSPKDTSLMLGDKISITITCKTSDVKIHYTLDGSEPNETSPIYEQFLTITKNTMVKAKAYKTGYHPSIVTSAQYDFFDPQKNGVRWELYRGVFKQLPDFGKLKLVKSGRVLQIDLSELKIHDEYFAMVFTGYIEITHKDEYTFYTSSNDGSKLYIDNKLVVDNDGEHGATERSGNIKLSPGSYPIKVTYFQAGASKVLNIFYKRQGFERLIVPGSMLYFEK
ncbi:family 78 glycoside hydrolase catalytic domain [candidate division KSB1 bacterium]|nr:family 78 glycoside hydrolase catalytic domain [candidate division KSB1 bacterium]